MKKYSLILLAVLLISAMFLPSCIPVSCSIPGINQPPVAYIDSIAPSPANAGEVVTFEGHGTDADGTIVAYRWRSSIDGEIGTKATFDYSALSPGDHVIYFKVQDNKGAWSLEDRKDLTVTGSATPTTGLPVIDTFIASPPSISEGASSTISWEVTDATSVSIDQGIGEVSTSGSRSVSPSTTTTYKLTASNSTGSAYASCQVVVSGGGPIPSSYPVINYFTASPSTVGPGEMTTLSWSVSNAFAVTIDQGVGSVASTGSMSIIPVATTMFTLTAVNAAGSASQSVMITVSGGSATYQVIRVLSTGAPASGTRPCPYEMVFTFEIKTNGPCNVTYHVERSDGLVGPSKTMSFMGAETKFLTSTWSATSSGTYSETLYVTSPNALSATSVPVTITCEEPFAVTSVLNTGGPASGSRPCPYTMNFSFSITTNGAGTVSYHTERSDGATGPTKSMLFTAAGTKTLTSSWTVSSSGSYWVKLVISAPNSTYRKSTTVNLTCE